MSVGIGTTTKEVLPGQILNLVASSDIAGSYQLDTGQPGAPNLGAVTNFSASQVINFGPYSSPVIVKLVITQGTITDTFSKHNPTVGTTIGDSAPAGSIGEILSTTVAPATVSLSTGTAADVATVALTPGDWEVTGVINYTPTGTTSITKLGQGASSTANTLGAQDTYSQDVTATQVPGANVITKVIPRQRFNVSSNTTIHLVALAAFTVSTLTAGGTITARRMR